ncbi:MAG: signal peptidase I [bacterium]|nr:signal peptidase I [bacterium]
MDDEAIIAPEDPKERGARGLFKDGLQYVGELVRVVVISLAIILPVRYFLLQPFYVKGASMEPNFYDHEYLIIDELSYRFRAPLRGEIVVFRPPTDSTQFFIKRVVGLPGETVRSENGYVVIENAEHPEGVRLPESYLNSNAVTIGGQAVVLEPHQYYVMGDNRSSSLDSRQFGAIGRGTIVGRVWVRGWPLDRVGKFMAPEYEIDQQTTNHK